MPTITVNITGANAAADAQAARYIVGLENERRAALDPPGTPLPTTPPPALVASYETVLAATLTTAHDSYVAQAAEKELTTADIKKRWGASSDAQRTAALAALAAAPGR